MVTCEMTILICDDSKYCLIAKNFWFILLLVLFSIYKKNNFIHNSVRLNATLV
jgi:hypothetical protein